MYLLSQDQRNEFLAVPELARLVLPDNVNTPSLLVKTTTLMAKYFYRLRQFVLIFSSMQDGTLLTGVQIADDPMHPGTIWSVVAEDNEIKALKLLASTGNLDVFIFNEAAVNLLSTSIEVNTHEQRNLRFLDDVRFRSKRNADFSVEEIGDRLDAIRSSQEVHAIRFEFTGECDWRRIQSHYITNSIRPSLLSLIEENEGDQQEELAVWFTDVLQPQGAVKQPQIPEGSKTRELCDVLLTYGGGSFLIESKALTVMERGTLPDRAKLKKNTLKSVKKALSQLSGACRSLRRKLPVTTLEGRAVEVAYGIAEHCIVLVPDLSLLDAQDGLGTTRILEFYKEEGAYLHVMDPVALLRSVQHALILAEKSESGLPPIMTFDYALIKRWEASQKFETPDFAFLIRSSSDADVNAE
jgi:hypothetical protein